MLKANNKLFKTNTKTDLGTDSNIDLKIGYESCLKTSFKLDLNLNNADKANLVF